MESNNLHEIFQLLLQLYQEDINRKSRLENKAIGYLTFISIILAVSIVITIFLLDKFTYWNVCYIILVITLFAQFYFAINTFIFSLRAYDKRKTHLPDPNEFIKSWEIDKKEFMGGINKTLIICIKKHKKMLKGLSFNVDMCKIFIYFSFTSFVIFIFTFFYIITIGGYNG
jgi:hypothetical protein